MQQEYSRLQLTAPCRVDNSAELAAEARYAFAAGLAVGEAGMQLARQALLIAAEDDAIGEHQPMFTYSPGAAYRALKDSAMLPVAVTNNGGWQHHLAA